MLRRYARGELSGDREHAVEEHLEADPMLHEAMEGWRAPGALQAAGSLRSPYRRRRPWNRSALGLVALTGIGMAVWSFAIDHAPSGPGDPGTGYTAQQDRDTGMGLGPMTRIASPGATPVSTIPVTGSRSGRARKDGPDGHAQHAPLAAWPTDSIVAEAIPSIRTPPPVIVKRALPSERLRRPDRQLLFLHDLKVVDPSELHLTGARNAALGGVRAQYADASEQAVTKESSDQAPYLEFIDDALGRFIRHDPAGALRGLRVILDQYPDDVNAIFYSGLCHYELGHFQQAIGLLARAGAHPVDSFAEEADWYRARSIEALQGPLAAVPLLDSIITRGGYYADQARAHLHR
ncbi:MAG: hypothetical protein H6597_01000 [Flavobacteriales bacterium]|nr:hypothetical protein [Flavobacteriales bacterium]MCB9193083.1 hypothetical protein [Flavobacteriales bacterium]